MKQYRILVFLLGGVMCLSVFVSVACAQVFFVKAGSSVSGTANASITVKRAQAIDTDCGSNTPGWDAGFDSQLVITSDI